MFQVVFSQKLKSSRASTMSLICSRIEDVLKRPSVNKYTIKTLFGNLKNQKTDRCECSFLIDVHCYFHYLLSTKINILKMWRSNAVRHRKISLVTRSERGVVKVAIKVFKKTLSRVTQIQKATHTTARSLPLLKCNQTKFGR